MPITTATAEYQRTRRAKATARGLCSGCRKHHARPGLRTCAICADKDGSRCLRQEKWRECCQSTDDHRFDCAEVPPEQRGKGPFGPTTPPTAAELVAALRRVA